MRRPIRKIQPTGGDPLYEEEATGLLLTATDFAARNGCTEREVEEKYQEAMNDRRTAEHNIDQVSSGI